MKQLLTTIIALIGKEVLPSAETKHEDVIVVHAVIMDGRLDRKRIEIAAPAIQAFLNLLPDAFRTEKGIALDKMQELKNGIEWAETPADVDALLVLGLAANLLEFTTPRSQWRISGTPQVLPFVRQVTPPGAGSR